MEAMDEDLPHIIWNSEEYVSKNYLSSNANTQKKEKFAITIEFIQNVWEKKWKTKVKLEMLS